MQLKEVRDLLMPIRSAYGSLRVLTTQVKFNVRSSAARRKLGQCRRVGDFRAARDAYRRLLAQRPTNRSATRLHAIKVGDRPPVAMGTVGAVRAPARCVWVVEYALDGASGGVHRLLATVLDPAVAPAAKVAALHHERREVEAVHDEIKTRIPGSGAILRSRTPDPVQQQVWDRTPSIVAPEC